MALSLPHMTDSAVTGDDGGRFHSRLTLMHYRTVVGSSEGDRVPAGRRGARWESFATQETAVVQQQQVCGSKETQVNSLRPLLHSEEALVNGAQHRGHLRPRHPVIRDGSSLRSDASLQPTCS